MNQHITGIKRKTTASLDQIRRRLVGHHLPRIAELRLTSGVPEGGTLETAIMESLLLFPVHQMVVDLLFNHDLI